MPKIVCRIALLCFFLLIHTAANADEMAGSCMASFKIKPDAKVVVGGQSVYCEDVESRRIELFNQINQIKSEGQIDLTPMANQLTAISQQLDKIAANDYPGLGMNITGNALATISLGACFSPASAAGCALAAIGKVLSAVGLVRTAMNEQTTKQAIHNVTGQLATMSTDMQGKSSPAAVLRNRLVNDFNGLCVDVKKYCVEH